MILGYWIYSCYGYLLAVEDRLAGLLLKSYEFLCDWVDECLDWITMIPDSVWLDYFLDWDYGCGYYSVLAEYYFYCAYWFEVTD